MSAPLASVTAFMPADDQDVNVAGTVALVVRDFINAATATALHYTDLSSWVEGGRTIAWHTFQGGVLPLQRNQAVWRLKGDWLLFIDDDMVWQRDAVGQLVKSWQELRDPLAMMGGLCFRRSAPYAPTMFMREQHDRGAYNFLEDWTADIVEVDATGCAFLLIPKAVFEAIAGTPFPPYDVRRTLDHGPEFFRWQGGIGEDLRFCQDAKAAGCRIYVDTRIEIGHISEVVIDKRDFWRSIAERPQETEHVRTRVNTLMGLPTLTRQEARKRLGWD